jgi:hypothetical protein
MTDGDPEAIEQTRALFDELDHVLTQETADWTLPVVVRFYDAGEDGEEDQKDEAMLKQEHDYTSSLSRRDG